MSDNSLNNLCMNKLVETFVNAPPMIRDMVTANVSTEIIKEKKQRIRKNTINDMCQQNTILIPELVKWMNDNGKTNGMMTFDDRMIIHSVYKTFDQNIVATAIDIAEEIIGYMEGIHASHIRWGDYNELGDSSSDESDADY